MPINRAWKLVARPEGLFKPTDVAWAEEHVPDLVEGQVLVRQLHLSLDPTNRGWVRTARSRLEAGTVYERKDQRDSRYSDHPVR